MAQRVEFGQVHIGGSYAFPAALTAPDNTLRANGATLDIADYPELFDVYGTTFGGNGTTTFQIATISGYVTRVR